MRFNSRAASLALLSALAMVVASCSAGVSDGGNAGRKNPDGATSQAPSKKGSGAQTSGKGDPTAGLTEEQKAHLVSDAKTTWDVKLSDDTTLVQGDALGALQSEGGDGTFVFDKAAAQSAGINLDKGRVLLLAGKALRRITGVSTSGSKVTVRTGPASLADAIESGTVGWDVPLDFDFDQFVTAAGKGTDVQPSTYATPDGRPRLVGIGMAMPDGRTVPVRSTDDPGIDIKVKPKDGAVEWTFGSGGNKYQFRVTAKGDSADFLVVVSRGGDDPTMAYRGEGQLGALRSSSKSKFAGGSVTNSKVGVDNLSAKLKLSASVAGAGVSPVKLEVPVPFLRYIWMVGPIPVTVDIKANIIGSVKATLKASATASAAFSYRGDAGFSFDGTDVSASGDTGIGKMDPDPVDSAAPMGVDVDAQFGVSFPEISLSIFGQGLVPSLHFGAVVGSNLFWGEPKAGFAASSICKSGYVRAEVVGKYALKFLDMDLGGGEHTFWEKRKDAKADSQGCKDKDKDKGKGGGSK